jgi:uncharacterized membrane protein
MIVETNTTIQKSLFDVFKVATDYENLKQWQPHVEMIKLTEGTPVRTGTMVYIEKKFMGATTVVSADIINFQRHKSVEMSGVQGRFRFRRTTEFISGGRETVIKDKIEMPTGCIYSWYAPFLRAALTRQVQREWASLKQLLEKS